MTNQQLRILVRSWANSLAREIDDVRDQLPDTMPRETERVYIGPEPKPKPAFSISVDSEYMKARANPENWEDQPNGDYLILAGLKAFLAELQQAEDDLEAAPLAEE